MSRDEIIGVKVCHRRTDRQTDTFFDTIYGDVWIFSCRGITKLTQQIGQLNQFDEHRNQIFTHGIDIHDCELGVEQKGNFTSRIHNNWIHNNEL